MTRFKYFQQTFSRYMQSTSEGIEQFILAREAQGLRPRTLEVYRERLGPFCRYVNNRRLRDIDAADLDGYMVHLRRRKILHENSPIRPSKKGRLSPATIEGYKAALKVFFAWCVDRGLLDKSPAAHLKRRKFNRFAQKRAMDADTLMTMLAYAGLAAKARNPVDIRDLAVLALCADSLARVGEVSGLDVDDVLWNKAYTDGDSVVYEALVEGKVGERLITFSEPTALLMLDWLDVRPEVESPALFLSLCRWHFREPHGRCGSCRLFGQRFSTTGIAQMFRRIATRAGVKGKVNPHSVRHLGGIVYAERAGIDVAQEKLGHSTIVTTRMHYVPLNRDRVRSETARLSPVVNRRESDKSDHV